MYIINENTYFLYFDGNNTIVKEKETELKFGGNKVKAILDHSCINYGSSFKGRCISSKYLLEGKYKLPIIISEKKNIIFFPLNGAKNDEIIWVNFNAVEIFYHQKEFVRVRFKNNFIQDFMTSFTIFNNQMFKCSRLWLIYLTKSG